MADIYLDEEDDVVLGRDEHSEEEEEMAPRARMDKKAQPGQQAQKEEGSAKPPTKRKATAPRPKLTLDLLQDEKGFNHVFHKFPEVFRAGFKGKGHEVADLQRLLEMYSRWQQRIFPHCSFDEFIFRIEKFSGSKLLKNELEQLRMKLLILLDPDAPADQELQPGMDDPAGAGAEAGAGAGHNPGLGTQRTAMQQLAMLPALAGGRANNATAQQPRPGASMMTVVGPSNAAANRAVPVGQWGAGVRPDVSGVSQGPGRTALTGTGSNMVGPGLRPGGGAATGAGQQQQQQHRPAPATATAVARPVVPMSGPQPMEEGPEEDDFDDELVAMQADSGWEAAMDVLDDIEGNMDPQRRNPQPAARSLPPKRVGGTDASCPNTAPMEGVEVAAGDRGGTIQATIGPLQGGMRGGAQRSQGRDSATQREEEAAQQVAAGTQQLEDEGMGLLDMLEGGGGDEDGYWEDEVAGFEVDDMIKSPSPPLPGGVSQGAAGGVVGGGAGRGGSARASVPRVASAQPGGAVVAGQDGTEGADPRLAELEDEGAGAEGEGVGGVLLSSASQAVRSRRVQAVLDDEDEDEDDLQA